MAIDLAFELYGIHLEKEHIWIFSTKHQMTVYRR